MYYNGQIIYNLDTGKPFQIEDGEGTTYAWCNPGNSTHFLKVNEKYETMPEVPKFAGGLPQLININGNTYRYTDYRREERYSIALPESVEEAEELMKQGKIFPAPR